MTLEEELRPFFLAWDSYWEELCKAKFKYVEDFRGEPQTLSSKKFSCLEEVDKYYTNLIKPLLKEFFDKYPLIEQGLGDPSAIKIYKHLNLCPWRTSLPRIEMQVLGIEEKNVLPSKEITFVLSSEKEVALYCHMLLVSLIRKPLRFPKDLSPKSPNIWEFIEGLSKEMQEEFITNLLERLYVLGMKRPEGVEPEEYKKYLEKSINENIELAWSIARHYALLRSQGWQKAREQREAVRQMVICLIKWKRDREEARGEGTETPAYQWEIKGQEVYCNDSRPIKLADRMSKIFKYLHARRGKPVKIQSLEKEVGLTRESIRDAMIDLKNLLSRGLGVDRNQMDKIIEAVKDRKNKNEIAAYVFH